MCKLSVASWVDNLYFPSSNAASATLNAELMASFLRDTWGLTIKTESKMVMTCKGADRDELHGQDWQRVSNFDVLGFTIQYDGGWSLTWKKMIRKAWCAFWANCRQRGWQRFGIRH